MRAVIVHDHKNKKSSVEIDSHLLLDNIHNMRQAGMNVLCQDTDPNDPKTLHGYTIERGVYYDLIDEYEYITGKRMNKW